MYSVEMYSELIIKNHVILVVFKATPDPRIERASAGARRHQLMATCTSVI
jgi:hypothetical protein